MSYFFTHTQACVERIVKSMIFILYRKNNFSILFWLYCNIYLDFKKLFIIQVPNDMHK